MYYDVAKTTITVEGEDLCNAEEKGKIIISMKVEQNGPDWGSSVSVQSYVDSDAGYFDIDGVQIMLECDPNNHKAATATHVIDLSRCSSEKQEGNVYISLHGRYYEQASYELLQRYKVTWNYECCGCCGECCVMRSFGGTVMVVPIQTDYSSEGDGSRG